MGEAGSYIAVCSWFGTSRNWKWQWSSVYTGGKRDSRLYRPGVRMLYKAPWLTPSVTLPVRGMIQTVVKGVAECTGWECECYIRPHGRPPLRPSLCIVSMSRISIVARRVESPCPPTTSTWRRIQATHVQYGQSRQLNMNLTDYLAGFEMFPPILCTLFIMVQTSWHVSHITPSSTERVLFISNVRHQRQSIHTPARLRKIDSSGSSLQWANSA